MNLTDSVKNVRFVGEKTYNTLDKYSIYSVNDLINFLPRTYEDRSNVVLVRNVETDEVNVIEGYIKENLTSIRRKTHITTGRIYDESGSIKVIWFNRPYIKNNISPFEKYVFVGNCREESGKMTMFSPDIELLSKEVKINTNRIIPIYSLGKSLSQKVFRKIVFNALENITDIVDLFPKKIRTDYDLVSKDYAIKNIHFPENDESFFKARRRFVFEELFMMQCSLLTIKNISEKPTSIGNIRTLDKPILDLFPYRLTKAQNRVLEDIKKDFNSGFAMNRLVQGDVGSGKTAIAMVACYIMCKNGYQSVMMAPTEVLAKQHYYSFKEVFSKLGIEVILLSGSLKMSEKKEIYREISANSGQIIIGTNAVIQKKAVYRNIGLVITDEQHRFGVKQRMNLTEKGDSPHTLVMTATPIPRTLGLILYGDLNVSVIDELPPNRKEIETIYVNSSYLERIYAFMEKALIDKKQCYVVCPLIDESEETKLKSVVAYTDELKKVFRDFEVECLHGKMKQSEKDDLMDRFSSNKINVLVSTTVIEVGINVPNSTIMLILNAERFGLSQLHQLRGRVGRGSDKSYCILISDSKNENTTKRLKIMTNSGDGFVIAEKDLELRGQGDFFGVRQHGLPEFKIANLFTDINILQEVQEVVEKVNTSDNYLDSDEKSQFIENLDIYKNNFNKEIIL
ncbi:MAG: ATP-dependent DNA helicase RecG [Lachnospirales bacterium]